MGRSCVADAICDGGVVRESPGDVKRISWAPDHGSSRALDVGKTL